MKIVLTRDEVLDILEEAIYKKYAEAFIENYDERKIAEKDNKISSLIVLVNESAVVLSSDNWEFSLNDTV